MGDVACKTDDGDPSGGLAIFDADADRLNEDYLAGVQALEGDEKGRRRAWRAMAAGSATYHGRPVAFNFLPQLYPAAARPAFARIAQTMYGILSKVIDHYCNDVAFRQEFRFDSRVQELVLLPWGCDEPLPFARFDLLRDAATGAMKFCEFNTDASSGMNEAREALAALGHAPSFQQFVAAHECKDDTELQFAGWVSAFADLWRRRQWPVEPAACRPRVAIVACLDSPCPDEVGELSRFVPLFEERGFDCSVFDVRQLSFNGETLWGHKALVGSGEVPIDAIWRFCIVVDLLENWERTQPLIEALRQRKVFMAGSFATQIVHDKQVFAVLRRPAAQEFLTLAEREFVNAHVPPTYFLDDPRLDRAALRRDRERWVIKPTDWYASKNVVAGADCTADEWERCLREHFSHSDAASFIAQEFTAPCRSLALPLYGRPLDFTSDPRSFGNLLGLYCHAGQFAGIYLRQGPCNVIGSAREGLVAPVLWAK